MSGEDWVSSIGTAAPTTRYSTRHRPTNPLQPGDDGYLAQMYADGVRQALRDSRDKRAGALQDAKPPKAAPAV